MAYTNIKKSSDYFNTKLYTGNGATNAITGVDFQPDMVWIKDRTVGFDHVLQDSVRGTTKIINSNQTYAEFTNANSITSFNSDGFTTGSYVATNQNTTPYVSWNWKANGTGSANTDGSISSTVSASTTSGFSIVKYTGNGSTNQTVGHGLGAEPDFIIIKQTNTTRNWPTYSKAMGNGVAFLDIADAWNGGSGYTNYWYTSGMTSTTFGISNNDNNNQSGGTFIAYVFSSKTGYSKFGKYTGNGSADGTFVYTGFKPAFVIIKKTNGAGSWWVDDNKRDSFNPTLKALQANASAAEVADGAGDLDFLSNGFKCRDNTDAINVSGGSYIYMAFASEPLVGDNPATAR